jgi:hypothetical protein
MYGLVVCHAGDVQNQELVVEPLRDFVVAEHLLLKDRRSDTASGYEGNRSGEEVKGRTMAQDHKAPSGDGTLRPDDRLRDYGYYNSRRSC